MEFSAVKTIGKAPSPRSWHGSAVLSNTKFLIHGGYNGNNALSDTFIFDIGETQPRITFVLCVTHRMKTPPRTFVFQANYV